MIGQPEPVTAEYVPAVNLQKALFIINSGETEI